jgi:hypothetical protein
LKFFKSKLPLLLCLSASVVGWVFSSGCHPAALVIPSYIQSVGVQLFDNRTSYFGLETLFTQTTIREFQMDGRLPLEDPDKADLLVKVVIRQYDKVPVFNDPKTNAVLQYRLSITYDLAAVDQKEKKTFVEDNGKIHSYYYYTPQYNGAINQTEDQAVSQLASDMSHTIVRRVLEGY